MTGIVSRSYFACAMAFLGALIFGLTGTLMPVAAQTLPVKPLRLIVPCPAGSAADVGNAVAQMKSGKLKGLAVGTLKRTQVLPDIPTLDEAGVKGYEASNWYAIATASGTPQAIVMKLHDEIARYFKNPEVQKQMTAMGAVIDLKTPDEMRKFIPLEIDKWTKVAIDAHMPRAMD